VRRPVGKRDWLLSITWQNKLLAFGGESAQASVAISVLACLPATRLILGRSFQVIHYYQIVRYAPDLCVDYLEMEANHAYRNS
jgi:hypothetical protein